MQELSSCCHSSENSLCSTTIRHSGGEPAPYPDTGPESSLRSPPTLDYRRKDCRHFHLPWCRWQPAWLITMKIGSGKPVVRATLVAARSRHQPTFISLMWSDKAIVIPRSAATKILQSLPRRRRDFLSQSLPRRADRGRQNGIVAMIQPRLPVIPSAARNLKSITTRPVSQCHAYIVTKSENSVRTLYVGFTLRPTF